MDGRLIGRFVQLIAEHTGLHVREQDRASLSQKLQTRMKSLKISLPEKYYDLLERADSEGEWRELTLLLTTGESYFFRDRELFNLLKTQLLPEIIDRKKQQQITTGAAERSLRIWSAGCSTGEEPYSLAVLVKQLIPDLSNWNIFILGTDLNQESIAKAKLGIYNSWSFRKVDPELQKQYFKPVRSNWKIDDRIQKMVSFKSGNLLKDNFPNYLDIYDFDLIICRNVFIYFDFQTVATIVKKIYRTLNPEGYFISGHTELYGQSLGNFKVKSFPEAVVYQRPAGLPFENKTAIGSISEGSSREQPSHLVATSIATVPRSLVTEPESHEEILERAKTWLQKGDFANAIKAAELVIQQQSTNAIAYEIMAQAYARSGNNNKAMQYCDRAIGLGSGSVKSYYILAHTSKTQGKLEEAKDLLKKVIYLAPSSILAYLELGSIYEKEGDINRSFKMRKNAWEILQELPSSTTLEHHEKVEVSEVRLQLKNFFQDCGSRS
jgi:chemotaxis protein methyltransferase CheR